MIAELALGISGVSAVAAAYAAVQSRHANEQSARALAWEQERDRKRSSPDVRIEFEHGMQSSVSVINPNDPKPARKHYELTVAVVNYGETGRAAA